MSYSSLDTALEAFADKVSETRQGLYLSDVSLANTRGFKALKEAIHASSYVHIAAALEVYVNEFLRSVLDEISSRSVDRSRVKLGLLAISFASSFDSLQAVRGLKMWHQRAELLSSVNAKEACLFPPDSVPLDGRTVRKKHLEALWAVFGFAGYPLPNAASGLALHDLADTRNRVAHGEEQLGRIARSKPLDDTLKLYLRIEEIAIHLWSAGTRYLDKCEYLR